MIEIPPPRAKERAHGNGSFVGVSDALKELRHVGDTKDVPQRWERALHGQASRLGIKITIRRLGRTDVVTVYRIA